MELVAAPQAQKAGEEVEEHESNGEAEADSHRSHRRQRYFFYARDHGRRHLEPSSGGPHVHVDVPGRRTVIRLEEPSTHRI
jgi:hypothetical protein